MANYVTQTSDRKKSTAMKLCCLGFLGLGGIHQFYVGNIGKGLVYIFTLGWFYVGTIADLIKIALGSFRDNVGAPLRE